MKALGLIAFLLASAGEAGAHPVPFSYLDIHVVSRSLDVTLIAHVFDVAHDLGISPPERLLDDVVLKAEGARISALVAGRVRMSADGGALAGGDWSAPEALVDRQSLQLTAHYDVARPPGHVTLNASLFPYDPAHQTFVNVYDGDDLRSQAILDAHRTAFDYFPGSRQGVFAVVRRFVPDGIRHIVIGPEHVLFFAGLLLLGGTAGQRVAMVMAFTLGHTVTLSLAALHILAPPSRLIEPAVALTLVYVGVDNLLVRGGPDMRAWIAVAFGCIHGFGFANALRAMDLPGRVLVWSLTAASVGLVIGQSIVVLLAGAAFQVIRSRSVRADRQLARAGSFVVMAAGTFWFIQRVFFSGGIS